MTAPAASHRPADPGFPTPIVLVAHGSRDPRAAAATRALVRAVEAAVGPGAVVRASYLDHTLPRPAQVLTALEAAGERRAVLVPLLLTEAFHGRVDIPGAVAAARADGLRMPVAVSDVLGPRIGGTVDGLLLAALRRRLAATGEKFDAVVLAAAGTRDAAARRTVAQAAGELGATLGVPCRAAYASAAPPTAGEAVAALRAGGARRVAVAAYFLAPGLLYEAAMASARDAGAVATAAPLEGAAELARLVLSRVATIDPLAASPRAA
ncbi:Sirohydrochlorin ferrochelatase [Micromonospora pattaloongensis]|uniref:Sirohydrochlorin ferrochelatase n=2 Tax=Micromonospora pattaloongensis TaxID=405436 RepID=A0A1H3G0B7_9ACTN|nr:CbiX/SirB N-terminal domain-containing protein [Micromonospora pattaloongensis]SDX96600.1 Sirohydrochlorin ferrochelatase [Micromonospora pattaloongensis]